MSYRQTRRFVCLDDITETPEEMNWVIYNPNMQDTLFAAECLQKRINERFKTNLKRDELYPLVFTAADQLDTFIASVKVLIERHKAD